MTLFNADIKIYTSNNKIYTNTNARVEKMEKSSAASAKKEKKPERKKITKADVGGEKAFCILPHRVREGVKKLFDFFPKKTFVLTISRISGKWGRPVVFVCCLNCPELH